MMPHYRDIEYDSIALVLRNTSRWKGVWLHAAMVGVVAFILYADDPIITLIVGGLLITPTYILLGIYQARSAPLSLSPLSFYFFWYAVGLGLSPFYAAYLL